MSKIIKNKTIAPMKGDLVEGHKVYAFFTKLPALPGTVVAVSRTGHRVTVDFGAYKMFGIPRRDFTWRRSVNAYQDEKQKTRFGDGLALVTGRK